MQNGSVESYQTLADGIILQAVSDYRKALAGEGCGRNSAEKVVEECEQFFRSHYFSLLTTVSGEYLIEKLRKEVQDESHFNSTDT